VVKANQRQNNQEEMTIFPTDEPILTDVVVAYIKSSQNKEVVGSEEPTDRLDAESKPAVLELSLTNDEYRQLVEAYENGYRLVVSY
jgi:predicted DNA binding protein